MNMSHTPGVKATWYYPVARKEVGEEGLELGWKLDVLITTKLPHNY